MKKILKVFFIFCLLIIIFNKNIAKYIEKINIISETKISRPIIEIEKEEKIIITKIDLEKEIEYRFKIKNYNEKQQSNIEFLYFIEIQSDISNEIIEFKIIDVSENIQIKLINNKTENIKIPIGEYEKEYKLITKLKDEKINGNVNIKIGVIQNK